MKGTYIFLIVLFGLNSFGQNKKPHLSKHSLEISTGFNSLLASPGNTFITDVNKTDQYSGLFNVDLAYFYSTTSDEHSPWSFGVCYKQWVYTVKRTYADFYSVSHFSSSSVNYETLSNEFTVFRPQASIQIRRSFSVGEKCFLSYLFGAGCLFPCKSAKEEIHYVSTNSTYSPPPPFGNGTSSSYYQKTDTTDLIKEGTAPLLQLGGSIYYAIHKKNFFFVEPNVTVTSIKEKAGFCFIFQLRFGLKFNLS
jgi:hypothetical protein